jgi:hypothetical protein
MVGPRETDHFPITMFPHSLFDHHTYSHGVMMKVDVVTADMRVISTTDMNVQIINTNSTPPPERESCSGGPSWAAPTCAPDQSQVPLDKQTVTFDCTFIAGLCPGLCNKVPTAECTDKWVWRKCANLASSARKCQNNRNIRENCKKTCSEHLNTTCSAPPSVPTGPTPAPTSVPTGPTPAPTAAAYISMFYNPTYVDVGESLSSEATNMLNLLEDAGVSVNTFSDLDDDSWFSDIVVVPELENNIFPKDRIRY